MPKPGAMRVEARPEIFRWARERSGQSLANLHPRFPRLESWERGEVRPTLRQLEAFAKAVFVPIGYFFLPEPPEERIPIPDFRTVRSELLEQASPNLLDVIYLCQRRQAWYRDYARVVGEEPRNFVGSVQTGDQVTLVADEMRRMLNFDLKARQNCPTWTEALRQFIDRAEDAGVLVMVSGVVGSNTRRKLDPNEFRGFALADELAPLIFINGADTKAAQMFSLAHELAHLWLGQSALSDVSPNSIPAHRIERWCNQVAAELLVPLGVLQGVLSRVEPLAEVQNLARQFKVSTLVILRRIFDAELISWNTFQEAYDQELERLRRLPKSRGGDFYLTKEVSASRRFVRALVVSTMEGQTLYREAFQLLGIKKERTFAELSQRLGISI